MGITNALHNRPVRVIGFIAALHAVVYGIGLMFGAGGFGDTVLYTALGSTPIVSAFAGALFLTGGFLMFAYVRNNPKTIKTASYLCALVWIYAAASYLVAGAWLLAIGIAIPWAILSSYLGIAHGNRRSIIAYDQSDKAQRETANEDRL